MMDGIRPEQPMEIVMKTGSDRRIHPVRTKVECGSQSRRIAAQAFDLRSDRSQQPPIRLRSSSEKDADTRVSGYRVDV